jgi:hypothetical protein
VEKMTGDHPRNTGPISSLRPWGQNAVGQALRVSGGKRKKALPNAWWCAGIRGSARQQEHSLKHGLYTCEAIEERRQLQTLMRQSRLLIQDIE